MSATQLASVTKVLVRAMVQRPRSNDQGFWDQFNRAQTVEEVGSAITAGTEQVFNTSGDVGKLRALGLGVRRPPGVGGSAAHADWSP
ncbi:hypothetical protein PI126_g21802 [Phytophthora idaei]|nr:hypothetical protein PI126_g21802 [Phytophthora idaei]